MTGGVGVGWRLESRGVRVGDLCGKATHLVTVFVSVGGAIRVEDAAGFMWEMDLAAREELLRG